MNCKTLKNKQYDNKILPFTLMCLLVSICRDVLFNTGQCLLLRRLSFSSTSETLVFFIYLWDSHLLFSTSETVVSVISAITSSGPFLLVGSVDGVSSHNPWLSMQNCMRKSSGLMVVLIYNYIMFVTWTSSSYFFYHKWLFIIHK